LRLSTSFVSFIFFIALAGKWRLELAGSQIIQRAKATRWQTLM
jgi:hypothetical protein